jgi:hypothetical protein
LLRDGSVIRGRVKDYDGEIGLFVDPEFGEITIPLESLGSIQDPVQRNRSRGYPIQLGFSGAYYRPVGYPGSSFGSNLSISAFAEFNLQFLRGLYAGVDFSHLFLTHEADAGLSFGISALTAGPIFKLLLLRSSYMPFINKLVP